MTSTAKVAIIGATGQLGTDLTRAFGESAVPLSHADIEITDPASVQSVLGKIEPDVVINTAAVVNLRQCQSDPERCFRVNAIGSYHVAAACKSLGAAVALISSDYVFDGSKRGYVETDATGPLNVYGASKVAAEQLVSMANERHYIFRTSWLFGASASRKGHDFPRLMLHLANTQDEVRVVDDQFGSPTYSYDLAGVIKTLVAMPAPPGIYHLTNQGACSWYELAGEIFRLAGIRPRLTPIGTAEREEPYRRPRSTVLVNRRLEQIGLPLLRPWRVALSEYVRQFDLASLSSSS